VGTTTATFQYPAILLPVFVSGKERAGQHPLMVSEPEPMRDGRHRASQPSFGGDIEYRSVVTRNGERFFFGRRISPDDTNRNLRERKFQLKVMDAAALGQTPQRQPDKFDHYEEIDYDPKVRSDRCYRPKWSYALHP